MATAYTAPTRDELTKAFGKGSVGKTIKVTPRDCHDAQKYIAKLDRAYRASRKSTLRFG